MTTKRQCCLATPFLLLMGCTLAVPAVAQLEALSTVQHQSATPAGWSAPVQTSLDGRFVLLLSSAPNLVHGQQGPLCGTNLFLLDTQTGRRSLVSHRFGEPHRCAGSGGGTISDDGRFVLFGSASPDVLAPGLDDNGRSDLFLLDRLTGTVELVSHRATDPSRPTSAGVLGGGLSRNGEWVVFSSSSPASELSSGTTDTNAAGDVFLFHRPTGAISLVSHRGTDSSVAASTWTHFSDLTPDGRFILLESWATDLVTGYVPGVDRQVYRYDVSTGSATLVSHKFGQPMTGGNDGLGLFSTSEISDDGRFVAFASLATDLVAGQVESNAEADVFLHDVSNGSTRLVSGHGGSATITANRVSDVRGLTPDGRYVLFVSRGSLLFPGMIDDPFGPSDDAFLFDRMAGGTVLVSRTASSPNEAAGAASPIAVDEGGAFATFHRSGQIWSFEQATATVRLVSHAEGLPDQPGSSRASGGLITPNGLVLLSSESTDYVSIDDGNGLDDAFSAPLKPGDLTLLTRSAGPSPVTTAGGSSEAAALSPDGRFALWSSVADHLVPGDTNHSEDAFLFDRRTRSRELVSPVAGQPDVPAGSTQPVAVTPSGRHVLLDSCSPQLVAGTTGPPCQTYLYDRTLGVSRMISHKAGQPLVGSSQVSRPIALSDDGRFVLFASPATDLVPGFLERNGRDDLFLYDVSANGAVLVTHAAGSPTTTGNEGIDYFLGVRNVARLTPDGRFVLFSSQASDHVAGIVDFGTNPDVFVFDRTTGAIEILSVTASNPTQTSATGAIAHEISNDGRIVLFSSFGSDFAPGVIDTNSQRDVFLRDRQTGITELLSHRGGTATEAANGFSQPVGMTPDGLFVIFYSDALNLLPPPGADPVTSSGDAFLYDRNLGAATLVSRSAANPRFGGTSQSVPRAVSQSGRWILFESNGGNLQVSAPPGNYSQRSLYLFDRISEQMRWVGVGVAAGLSADGSTMSFTSFESGLVPNDTNRHSDVLVYSTEIFNDGFESGSTVAWSSETP